MSVDSKEIELIIRANNQSKQTLDGVAKSINELGRTIDSQTAAAKKGAVSIDELKATFLQLQQAQDKLKNQAELISRFERVNTTLAATAEKSAKAATAYQEYAKKVAESGTLTEGQAAKLAKLEAASARADGKLKQQAAVVDTLKAKMTEAGIATDNLAAAEETARRSAADLGLQIGRINTAISTFTTDLRAAKAAEKEFADLQEFEAKVADASKLVKVADYVNFWTTELNKIEAAERDLAESKAFDEKLAQAAKLNKAAEYVNFWTTALEKSDAAEKQMAVNEGLVKAADQAIATARGYQTLANTITQAQAPASRLASTLRAITDPAAEARSTLSGLEEEVNGLSASIAKLNGPVKDYRVTLQQLEAAQKAVMAQGGAVQAYQEQLQAVKAARAEFAAARGEVFRYAEQLRNSTGPSEQLNASLRNAQARLAESARVMRTQAQAARDMRVELQKAGVETNNLTAAEERLTAAAKTNVASIKALNAAFKEHGAAVDGAANGYFRFGDGGRTTLSLVQRIRGEILSLTATYLGLQGAIGFAASALETLNLKSKVENRLAVVVGNDPKAVGAEYEYLHDKALYYGVAIDQLADSYSKYGVAAKSVNYTDQQRKFVFEQITGSLRVLGASGQDTERAFAQLDQMLNKTKVQYEDIKALENSFPAVFASFAKGLADIGYEGISAKSSAADLFAAMKKGSVDAGQALYALAIQLQKEYGELLPQALGSLAAEQGRFATQVFDFKNEVASAGFGQAYIEFLKELGELLKSAEGKEFAKTLSEGLVTVLDVLKLVIENLDLIILAMELAFGIKAATMILNLTAAMPALVAQMNAMAIATNSTAGAVGKLRAAFLLLSSFIAGWAIGETIRDKYEVVRLAGVALNVGMQKIWFYITAGAQIAFENIGVFFTDMFKVLVNTATSGFRQILKAAMEVARALGSEGVAKSIGEAMDKLTLKLEGPTARTKQLVSELRAQLAQLDATGFAAFEGAKDSVAEPGKPVTATGRPGKPGKVAEATDENAGKKRAALILEIENEIAAIRARAGRQEKDDLDARLKAIDDQYEALTKKIKKLGGTEGKQFAAQLEAEKNKLKLAETEKYNQEIEKLNEALQGKIDAADAKAGRRQRDNLQARLDAVSTAYRQLYDEIAAAREKAERRGADTAQYDLMKARLDAAVEEQKVQTRKQFALDQLTDREKQINNLLDERKAKLAVIAAEEANAEITVTEAMERRRTVVAEMQPLIDEMATSAIAFAQGLGDAVDPTRLANFIAGLKEAQASAKGLKTELYSTAQANADIATGLVDTISTLAEGLGKAAVGAQSWSDAFKNAGRAFAQFAADFLMKIAQMILQQQILNAVQSSGGSGDSGGGYGAYISALVQAMGSYHDGGVVNGTPGRTQAANPGWFANAPRYHNGGMVGLQPDEYPAILKKNEEVLTSDDPRNVMNGGMAGGNGGTNVTVAPQDVKIVNMIDSGSVVSEGLNTSSGQRAIFNFIQANRTNLRTILR